MRSAVLCSGGLDSTVLLADELAAGRDVTPVHVRCGLAWEDAEGRTLRRLLQEAPFAGRTRALVTLTASVHDVYPANHWALTGSPPGFHTPDTDVYLPGRNLLLITNAAVWCLQNDVPRLALGSLGGNPFPDATPAFFNAMSRACSVGLAHPLDVSAPYLSMSKGDVIARGRALAVQLHLTLSCMNPGQGDSPCGNCSKCRERAALGSD